MRRSTASRVETEAGFTLIELSLAVAILGLVMSLVFSTISVQGDVGRTAQSAMESDQLARLALDRMVRDIETLVASGQEGINEPVLKGSPAMVDNYPGHELNLITRNGGQEPVIRVVYRLESTNDEGPLALTRREESLLGRETGPAMVVCRRVIALNINYIDMPGDQTGEWNKPKSPRLIRLKLTLKADRGGNQTFERLTMPLSKLVWKISK